ncbi:hypothetical protein, partial [Robiginitalea biformata]|uniref:hypothetical protein n=1 Tax=Robiginitalea biformata TaxID=252307 RepID=UPI003D329699
RCHLFADLPVLVLALRFLALVLGFVPVFGRGCFFFLALVFFVAVRPVLGPGLLLFLVHDRVLLVLQQLFVLVGFIGFEEV